MGTQLDTPTGKILPTIYIFLNGVTILFPKDPTLQVFNGYLIVTGKTTL